MSIIKFIPRSLSFQGTNRVIHPAYFHDVFRLFMPLKTLFMCQISWNFPKGVKWKIWIDKEFRLYIKANEKYYLMNLITFDNWTKNAI